MINYRSYIINALALSLLFICLKAFADKPLWEQSSQSDSFKLVIHPEGANYQIGQYHNWIINIKNVAGEPVNNALISIAGGMMGHGHGLPSQPVVTKVLNNGNYLIEGMLFNMSGEWTLDFHIKTPTVSDRARFNVELAF